MGGLGNQLHQVCFAKYLEKITLKQSLILIGLIN